MRLCGLSGGTWGLSGDTRIRTNENEETSEGVTVFLGLLGLDRASIRGFKNCKPATRPTLHDFAKFGPGPTIFNLKSGLHRSE